MDRIDEDKQAENLASATANFMSPWAFLEVGDYYELRARS